MLSSVFLVPRYLDMYKGSDNDFLIENILIDFIVFFMISVTFFSYLKVVFIKLKLVKEAPKNRFLL